METVVESVNRKAFLAVLAKVLNYDIKYRLGCDPEGEK